MTLPNSTASHVPSAAMAVEVTPLSQRFLILFCGITFSINPFSCDILLPALFPIARDFGVSIAEAQATIPVYLMFAAAGQVIFGPLSDKVGRKPVLIVGLALYSFSCLLAALAPTLPLLLAARVVQGIGASCAIVLARAVLRDTHSGEELARALSLSMAIFTAGPLLAPLIGAGFVALSGWRTAFWALMLLGLGLMTVTITRYRETNLTPDVDALKLHRLKAGALSVVTHTQSRRFIIVVALLTCNIVTLISAMPRVFKSHFGYEGSEFAIVFALCTVGIVFGQLIQQRAIKKIGLKKTLRLGALIFVTIVWTMAYVAHALPVGVALFATLMFLFNMTFLPVASVCTSLVLEPHKAIAGLAASIFGAATHLFGSGMALLMLPHLDGTLRQWSLVQALIVTAACLTILTWPGLKVAPSPDPQTAR